MAQSLKQLKTRIKTVENIHKTTRAMEMVSSAKLRSLQRQLGAARDYYDKFEAMKNDALCGQDDVSQALLKERPEKKNILLCVMTSDTGLCGSYNWLILRAASEFIKKNASRQVRVVVVGKKGLGHFKKAGIPVEDAYTELYGHYKAELSDKIAMSLMDKFLKGDADEVYCAYMDFESASRSAPKVEKLLNIEAKDGRSIEYLAEPGMDAILTDFLPLYVLARFRRIMLSAFTSEHSTRVVAMHEATKNAKELFGDLVLLRNKIRQAGITTEIIEVISSAGATKE